jgi:uncharacterized membrane protein YdjX (TVP38/TMEM64 family)
MEKSIVAGSEFSRGEGSLSRIMQVIRWISAGLIVAALLVIARSLPMGQILLLMESGLQTAGIWAPFIYVLAYALATVLMIPGSPLTIGAGAIFGLVAGTVVVSLGSTLGAALTFLIGRYLARDKIKRIAERYPLFSAIDRAVGEGGWKLVALVRLSPALPFNAQNYLYGLTAIRFWPCVLASWGAMLPGTFMYVYIGFIARQGAAAVAGETTLGAARWAMIAVGLLATVIATVFITRRAQAAMKSHIPEVRENATEEGTGMVETQSVAAQSPQVGTTISLGLLALAMIGLAACTTVYPGWINRLFGPPAVVLEEHHSETRNGKTFDHSAFDALLARYVDADGFVDYTGLETEFEALKAYARSLGAAPFDELGRDEKLALLINGYNAFTLQLILEYWDGGKLASIKDIPGARRWDDVRWNIAGNVWSLNQIEHEQIRPKFREPRIHFALVCAAYSCPKLRAEAFVGERLEEQLEDQSRYTHANDRWFRFDPDAGEVHLTMLYNPSWYGSDFEQVAPSVVDYAAQYSEALRTALDAGRKPTVKWIDYSWALNSQPR